MRRILGIDPGSRVTGYGVIEIHSSGPRLLEAGVVRSTSSKPMADRLRQIHEGVCEVMREFKPEVVAIEELYSHYKRPRTAILMGHARGVICLAASLSGAPVTNYAATQVKKMLTGNGRAPKSQIQHAICRQFDLTAPPEPPDVADALAIALCHFYIDGPRQVAI